MSPNVLVLALCQAFLLSGSILVVTTGALIASQLSQNPLLATLPISLNWGAALAGTLPASFLMQRVGRRFGFQLGAVIAMTGGAVAALGLHVGSFSLFCLGATLLGVYQAFGSYFRFAAIEVAGPKQRSKAVSLVLAGGIAAALVGPNLWHWGKWLTPASPAVSAYAVLVGFHLVSVLLLSSLKLAPIPVGTGNKLGRPISKIITQPLARTAIVAAAVSYGLMSLVMAATPLAMKGQGLEFGSISRVIEWHVLGMFLPSLVTGRLVHRVGPLPSVLTGMVLNGSCLVINWVGASEHHFGVAMVLLGIGWNLVFVATTTLLSECYAPEEKASVEGFNELVVLGLSALAGFVGGAAFNAWGWATLNLLALVPLAAVVYMILSQLRAGGVAEECT